MQFFKMKSSGQSLAQQNDAGAPEEAQAQSAQALTPPSHLQGLPNEIKAAIFGAIDLHDAQGVRSFAALQSVNKNFAAVGDDMLMRAINPRNEEADIDMAALREQLDGAWLAEDDTRDSHTAKKYLHRAANDRLARAQMRHTSTPIKPADERYGVTSSAFSPSGRLMAVGDMGGTVRLTDMQAVTHAADHPKRDGVKPRPRQLEGSGSSAAVALAFSANDKYLAVGREYQGDAPTDAVPCVVTVHDLTVHGHPVLFFIGLPPHVRHITSIALDALGKHVVVACGDEKVLWHAKLNLTNDGCLERYVIPQSVPLDFRCDGDVAFTPRGTLMYGAPDGHHEAVEGIVGSALNAGTRRPFSMPRPSHIGRRREAGHASDDMQTRIDLLRTYDEKRVLQMRTYVDGPRPEVRTSELAWDEARAPSVLFAPDNRHVLLTSHDGYAELVDTAPKASRRAAPQTREAAASRRQPITAQRSGQKSIRHAWGKLIGR